jgi:hypothetical protein
MLFNQLILLNTYYNISIRLMHAIEAGLVIKDDKRDELIYKMRGRFTASRSNKTSIYMHIISKDKETTISLKELSRGGLIILFSGYVYVIIIYVGEIVTRNIGIFV